MSAALLLSTVAPRISAKPNMLKGKVAFITGAARGIGKGYAEGILREGAKGVVVTDVLDDEGHRTVAELKSKYGDLSAVYVHVDVTSEEEIRHAFDLSFETFGYIDFVINNAGIGGTMTDRIIDVNLRGVVRCTEIAIECMRTDRGGKGGTIINITSQLAIQPAGYEPVYTATKSAIIGYTRSRGLQVGDELGIKFYLLCPGTVLTPMTQILKDSEDAGDASIKAVIGKYAGWHKLSDVVDACVSLLGRQDLPQGSFLLSDPTRNHLINLESMSSDKEPLSSN